MEDRLILTDPTDSLCRKVIRLEMNGDRDLVMLDLPKRFAGHERGKTAFTDPASARYLDQEGVLSLIAWLQEAVEELP